MSHTMASTDPSIKQGGTSSQGLTSLDRTKHRQHLLPRFREDPKLYLSNDFLADTPVIGQKQSLEDVLTRVHPKSTSYLLDVMISERLCECKFLTFDGDTSVYMAAENTADDQEFAALSILAHGTHSDVDIGWLVYAASGPSEWLTLHFNSETTWPSESKVPTEIEEICSEFSLPLKQALRNVLWLHLENWASAILHREKTTIKEACEDPSRPPRSRVVLDTLSRASSGSIKEAHYTSLPKLHDYSEFVGDLTAYSRLSTHDRRDQGRKELNMVYGGF